MQNLRSISKSPSSALRLSSISFFKAPRYAKNLGLILEQGREKIEIVLKGRAKALVEDVWVSVRPGSIIWHQEGDLTLRHPDPEDPYHCMAFSFEGFHPKPERRLSHWEQLEECDQFCRQHLSDFHQGRLNHDLQSQVILSRIRWEIHRFIKSEDIGTLPAEIHHVCQTIERNPERTWCVKEMAELANLGASRFYQIFRLHLKTTPHEYLSVLRMGRAKELLSSSGMSIKEIGYQCGYKSPAQFGRIFLHRVGLTPGQYRQKHLLPYQS
jgi:AraC-like DNA-binding protein